LEWVYDNGPDSCMSFHDDTYIGHCHPVHVYATDDCAVGYILDSNDDQRVVARAVLNMKDKQWVRPYGNEVLIEKVLTKNGYERGSLEGCRLQLIHDDTVEYIMPYLDGRADEVRIEGDYFVATDSGDYYADKTNGGLEYFGECCSVCGDIEKDVYHDISGYDVVCSHCLDNAFVWSESDGEYLRSTMVNGLTTTTRGYQMTDVYVVHGQATSMIPIE